MKLNIDKTIQAADIVDAMRLRQGEKGQTLTFTLYDGENAYTPPVGGSVWLKVKHADGNFAIKQGTWSSNTVSIVTDTALTAVAGRCLHAYIEVRNVNNTVVATTGDIPMVILAAADLSGQQSEHYVPIIDEVVGDLDSMTAVATSLPAGSEPTAQLDKSADPWTMRFGIPKGQAATIDVGETSTGEPGTDADVENVGTDTDAVFNFTIPKGAKGDKGDQGDPGNYTKPATGIPKSDLASGVQDALIPAGGITIDELAQAVADRLLIAGGAAGQALLKDSATDYDAVWGDVVAPGDIIPLTDGGTGGSYANLAALRNALGLGNTTGALPITNGGTGAASASEARSAIGTNSWSNTAYGSTQPTSIEHTEACSITVPTSGLYMVIVYMNCTISNSGSYSNTIQSNSFGLRTVRTSALNGGGSINVMCGNLNANEVVKALVYPFSATGEKYRTAMYVIRLVDTSV